MSNSTDSLIKLKRSAVQGKIPTTEKLSLGELAINTYDGRMYLKQQQGAEESIVEFVGKVPIANTFLVQTANITKLFSVIAAKDVYATHCENSNVIFEDPNGSRNSVTAFVGETGTSGSPLTNLGGNGLPKYTELVIYSVDQSNNRANIESIVNRNYNIY